MIGKPKSMISPFENRVYEVVLQIQALNSNSKVWLNFTDHMSSLKLS